MLKQRVITAVLLVVILLTTLLASNPFYWRLIISIALFLGFWEWLRFCQITSRPEQIFSYVLFVTLFLFFQLGLLPISILIIVTCLLWGLCLFFTLTNKVDFLHRPKIKLLLGMWLLSAAGYLLIELKYLDNGVWWILCCMIAIWAADIGAYFVGKRLGKTKLAPSISPGKTIEGLLGGLSLVVMIFIPILFWNFPVMTAFLLLLTVVITALLSVGGDLFESKLKRYVDLKDSSQILPGHGGVLDRVDSLLVGVPFFMLGLLFLGFIT